MYLDVGPYRFSGKDARRTLLHGIDFLDAFPAAVHPYQVDRRERMGAALGGIDLAGGEPDALEASLELVWAELMSARDDVVAASALPATRTGAVAALSRGDGGVPKGLVDRVEVDFGGVIGDRQKTRNHHGAPFQALCLWSSETIDGLAAAGHPIAPGRAGENVTVSGIEWSTVTPGVRLALGDVLCEVSSYAVPCAQNARWFSDRNFTRIHHRHGPISRMYATVLEPGSVSVGDAVVVEP